MNIGGLRQRAQLQEPSHVNADGEVTETYTTVATRWVSVAALTGRELLEAQQTTARATYRVRMRFYSGLAPKWRIRAITNVSGSVTVLKTLNIEHIGNIDLRNREYEVLCSEAAD